MAGLHKRGNVYYALFYVGKKQKRISLETDSLQFAKEKVRQLESSLFRGNDNPLPTKTPIATVVTDYIEHMEIRKTAKSVKRDVSYLRESFGPICPALVLKNVKNSDRRKNRLTKQAPIHIEANCFEQVTTADIANFIATQVRRKGLAPKTANRYREILTRLYNWAMGQNGIRIPGDKNPAAKVERYTEKAPVIVFLSLKQIDEQLNALAGLIDAMICGGLEDPEDVISQGVAYADPYVKPTEEGRRWLLNEWLKYSAVVNEIFKISFLKLTLNNYRQLRWKCISRKIYADGANFEFMVTYPKFAQLRPSH